MCVSLFRSNRKNSRKSRRRRRISKRSPWLQRSLRNTLRTAVLQRPRWTRRATGLTRSTAVEQSRRPAAHSQWLQESSSIRDVPPLHLQTMPQHSQQKWNAVTRQMPKVNLNIHVLSSFSVLVCRRCDCQFATLGLFTSIIQMRSQTGFDPSYFGK